MSVIKNIRAVKAAFSSDSVPLTEWLILFFISFFAFLSFRYIDLDVITVWSIYFLDCIADGNLFGYYQYTVDMAGDATQLYGWRDILTNIPLAIWNIPVWIAHRYFGVSILTSVLPVLWSKLFMVACLSVTALYAYKIARHAGLKQNKAIIAVFLTMSSSYTFLGVYYAAQNCIISVAFSSIAIYELFRERRTKFIVFSMLAVTMKPFFIFALLAVVLITEKRTINIVKIIALCLLPILFSALIFADAPMYAELRELDFSTTAMFYSLFEMNMPTRFGDVSFAFLFLLALYYMCFSKKHKSEQERNYFIIYSVTSAYIIMTVFVHDGFYRLILLIPFLYILILSKPETEKIGLIITALVSFMVTVFFTIQPTPMSTPLHVYSTSELSRTLWHSTEVMSINYVGQWIYGYVPNELYPLITVVIIFGMFWILAAYWPGSKLPAPYKNEKANKWVIRLNAYQSAFFVFGVLYLFLSK